ASYTLSLHDALPIFQVEFAGAEKDGKQAVFIAKDVEYYERADIRKVWTFAETLTEQPSQEIAMKLLGQSSRTKVGSWAIEQAQEDRKSTRLNSSHVK